MDPNYHYIPVSAFVYVKNGAPLAELGLPDYWDRCRPVNSFFYVYDETVTYMKFESNEDKFIDYLLKLGDKTKYLDNISGEKFSIVRVPIDVKEYASLKSRSSGCCGSEREIYVQFNLEKAIIDATKKMLEEPLSLEKVQQLKQRIEYLEKVQLEEVIVPYLSSSDAYDGADWGW